LSAGQAAYVLERLIADRRISPGEVSRYVSDMHREISDLESRLQTLRTHAGASTGSGGGTGSGSGTTSGGTSGGTTGARRGRPPGRPPGRPAGSGVTASGKRRGRPPGSKNVASSAASAPAASSGGGTPEASASTGGGKRRRRARITPEQLASRQLQGRYLGLIRQIPASRRAQYQKIAKDSGREAAINAMKSAVSR
jgi:hypothetical protein